MNFIKKFIGLFKKGSPKCEVCKKTVHWGQDGCPIIHTNDKSRAMEAVLFGVVDSWKHYTC